MRVDDLVSNVEAGGGYLWITAGCCGDQRLLRARLSEGLGRAAITAAGRRASAAWTPLAAAAGLLLARRGAFA